MRVIFIGDVHGCIDEFREIVDRLDVRPGDRVICLGDFMDKGPHPVACVRFARERKFKSVMGNHEERHLKWRRNEARVQSEPGFVNNMKPFKPADLAANAALSGEDIAWLQGLPIYLEPVPGLLAVHGGLLPGVPLEKQPADKIVRTRFVDPETGRHIPTDYDSLDVIRGAYWTDVYDGHRSVVYGHEVHSLRTPRIDRRPNDAICYGIDTGCVHGGRLTAMVVEGSDVRFVQIQARRVYQEPLRPILN